MEISVYGAMVHLQGDWTVKGLTRSGMVSLASSLQQIKPDNVRSLTVDLRDVTAIDNIGQQLLSGWLDIVKLRGIKTELVNPPDTLKNKISKSGFDTFV